MNGCFFSPPPQCFKIFASNTTRKLAWHDAREVCTHLGGNLASVPNQQVQGMYMGSPETCSQKYQHPTKECAKLLNTYYKIIC